MTFLLPCLLLGLSIFIPSSIACKCATHSLENDFYGTNTESFVRATVVAAYEPIEGDCAEDQKEHRKRFYTLKVAQEYKSCSKAGFRIVETGCCTSSCGMILEKGMEYVMPIPKGSIPLINSCMVRTRILEFYRYKNPNEFLTTILPTSPFTVHPPHSYADKSRARISQLSDGVSCEDNYCGDECRAEWLDVNGRPTCLPW